MVRLAHDTGILCQYIDLIQTSRRTYDIGRHSSVDVPKTDHHRERDTALVRPFHVIGYPRNDVRNCGVDPASRQEDCKIRKARAP